jgi:hypothetical protein
LPFHVHENEIPPVVIRTLAMWRARASGSEAAPRSGLVFSERMLAPVQSPNAGPAMYWRRNGAAGKNRRICNCEPSPREVVIPSCNPTLAYIAFGTA